MSQESFFKPLIEITKVYAFLQVKVQKLPRGVFGETLMGPEAGDIASLDNEMDLEEKAEFLEFTSLEHDRFKLTPQTASGFLFYPL